MKLTDFYYILARPNNDHLMDKKVTNQPLSVSEDRDRDQVLSVPSKKKLRYNKEGTKAAILHAAAEIIKRDGLKGLKINRLELESQRSKKMVYEYFGNMQGLLKQILVTNDPWLHYQDKIADLLSFHAHNFAEDLLPSMFESHIANYPADTFAQIISKMELTNLDNVFKELSDSRENIAQEIFNLTDEHFKNGSVNIRMVCALLIGGINYLVLHRNNNGSTFCGMDILVENQREILTATVKQILAWAYEHAKD